MAVYNLFCSQWPHNRCAALTKTGDPTHPLAASCIEVIERNGHLFPKFGNSQHQRMFSDFIILGDPTRLTIERMRGMPLSDKPRWLLFEFNEDEEKLISYLIDHYSADPFYSNLESAMSSYLTQESYDLLQYAMPSEAERVKKRFRGIFFQTLATLTFVYELQEAVQVCPTPENYAKIYVRYTACVALLQKCLKDVASSIVNLLNIDDFLEERIKRFQDVCNFWILHLPLPHHYLVFHHYNADFFSRQGNGKGEFNIQPSIKTLLDKNQLHTALRAKQLFVRLFFENVPLNQEIKAQILSLLDQQDDFRTLYQKLSQYQILKKGKVFTSSKEYSYEAGNALSLACYSEFSEAITKINTELDSFAREMCSTFRSHSLSISHSLSFLRNDSEISDLFIHMLATISRMVGSFKIVFNLNQIVNSKKSAKKLDYKGIITNKIANFCNEITTPAQDSEYFFGQVREFIRISEAHPKTNHYDLFSFLSRINFIPEINLSQVVKLFNNIMNSLPKEISYRDAVLCFKEQIAPLFTILSLRDDLLALSKFQTPGEAGLMTSDDLAEWLVSIPNYQINSIGNSAPQPQASSAQESAAPVSEEAKEPIQEPETFEEEVQPVANLKREKLKIEQELQIESAKDVLSQIRRNVSWIELIHLMEKIGFRRDHFDGWNHLVLRHPNLGTFSVGGKHEKNNLNPKILAEAKRKVNEYIAEIIASSAK